MTNKERINSKNWLCNCQVCRYWRKKEKEELLE